MRSLLGRLGARALAPAGRSLGASGTDLARPALARLAHRALLSGSETVRSPLDAEQPHIGSLFRDRPGALGSEPSLDVVIPPAKGLAGFGLWALGYYGRESTLIRGSRAMYGLVTARSTNDTFLKALNLPSSFRATHSLRILHIWLCLGRLRQEGVDGSEIGQTMYELFNHDTEKRIVAVGVKLLSKPMKELEKNFYGATQAYDAAVKPGADKEALPAALWRNVLAEDGSPLPKEGPEAEAAKALARYVRLTRASLELTPTSAFISGNFSFPGDFASLAEKSELEVQQGASPSNN